MEILLELLIDLVVLAHFGFILFVTTGGFLTWRYPAIGWFHVPLCLWGVAVSLFQWTCPLTTIERWLRQQLNGGMDEGGFVAHYLTPIIYPGDVGPSYFVTLGLALLGLNIIAYVGLWYRTRE